LAFRFWSKKPASSNAYSKREKATKKRHTESLNPVGIRF
jgi:hypothetical protein